MGYRTGGRGRRFRDQSQSLLPPTEDYCYETGDGRGVEKGPVQEKESLLALQPTEPFTPEDRPRRSGETWGRTWDHFSGGRGRVSGSRVV